MQDFKLCHWQREKVTLAGKRLLDFSFDTYDNITECICT